MQHRTQRHRRGFTLTELIIVLGVVGVLAAGLWNLMSGANQQVRDQSSASQQNQLIEAAKGFLADPHGQAFMAGNAGCAAGVCGPGVNFLLPLPTSCAPASAFPGIYAADVNLPTFCTFLPPNFINTTPNSFGQTFSIRVLRDATLNPGGIPPNSYTFMVMTAGVVIPDPDGARIASLIGGDGGFIYTNAVCGAPPAANACGAFGGWTSLTTAFGFVGVSGTVASRTYFSPQQNAFSSWLARIAMPGDATSYSFNTMTTPEYLGSHALVMGSFTPGIGSTPDFSRTFYMGDYVGPLPAVPPHNGGIFNMQGGAFNFNYSTAITGGGTMNVQGGTISMGGGSAPGSVAGGLVAGDLGSEINLEATPGTYLLSASYNSFINVSPGCTADLTNTNFDGLHQDGTCVPGIQDTGDAKISGRLSANSLYSLTFIYDSGGIVSDMRLKKNIKPLNNAMVDVEKLKPVTFMLKSTGKPSMGFLAQDIEKIYPDLVLETSDGYKAVNYDGLIAPLVGAVQDLRQQNMQLREELERQAASEKTLQGEIEALKNGR